MKGLLFLVQKLFGKNALGKAMGTRTNVIKLPNNEKKRLIKNELDIERASDAAAENLRKEAEELIAELPKMNDQERLIFEGNLRRLDNKLNPPSAEVIDIKTSKPVAGIEQLAAERGFPKGVDPESTMGRLLTSTRKLQDEAKDLQKMMSESPSKAFEEMVLKNPYRSGGPLDPTSGIVRTAARQILRKKLDAGEIDIPDAAERDAIAKGYQGGVDPIEVFRKRFGEDPLQDLDEIADELNRAGDFKKIDEILKRNKLFDIEPKKDYGYQEGSYTDEEMMELLKKSEDEPDKFAKGGKVEKGSPKIFDQLEMDVPHPYGHRTKFQEGGIFSGPAYQQYSQARSQAYENAPSKFQYDVMSNQAAGQFLQDRTREVMGNNMFSKIVGGIGSAAAIPFAVGASPFHEAIQAKERMEPGSGFKGYMKAFLNEQPLRTAMNRGIGVAASVPGVQQLGTKIGEGIYNLLNKGDVGQGTPSDVSGQWNPSDFADSIISDGDFKYRVNQDGSKTLLGRIEDGTQLPDYDHTKYMRGFAGNFISNEDYAKLSKEDQYKFQSTKDPRFQQTTQSISQQPIYASDEDRYIAEGFDYSQPTNWSPGQPAPEGYRVVNMMGDTFLEKKYPSKQEMAMMMMPPLEGLSGQEYAERYNIPYATGGRVGFALGSLPKGIQALVKQINKRFGKGAMKTADEMERPKSAKEKEMFEEFESRNPNPKRQLTDDEIKEYEEELGDSETWLSEGTVEEAEQALKRQKEYEAAMYRDYKAGKLDPKPGEKGRKEFLEKKLEEMEMSGDKKLMTRDEIEELSTFDLGKEIDELRSVAPKMAERYELKQKFPGIDDDLLTAIIDDPNPQRKAEVIATIEQAFGLMKKGKSPDEILDIMKQMTDRTKQAGGGLAYLMGL